MPFKRITINQGCQPHTPLRGTISRWGSMGRHCAEVWWVKERGGSNFPHPHSYRAERPLLMRLEVLY